jgi:hypothetical protein
MTDDAPLEAAVGGRRVDQRDRDHEHDRAGDPPPYMTDGDCPDLLWPPRRIGDLW